MVQAGAAGSTSTIGLTLRASSAAPPGGPYCLEITGTAADEPTLTASPQVIMFKILPLTTPRVSCAFNPSTLPLRLGKSGTSTVTVTPMFLPADTSLPAPRHVEAHRSLAPGCSSRGWLYFR
jgi:hypothetical protein